MSTKSWVCSSDASLSFQTIRSFIIILQANPLYTELPNNGHSASFASMKKDACSMGYVLSHIMHLRAAIFSYKWTKIPNEGREGMIGSLRSALNILTCLTKLLGYEDCGGQMKQKTDVHCMSQSIQYCVGLIKTLLQSGNWSHRDTQNQNINSLAFVCSIDRSQRGGIIQWGDRIQYEADLLVISAISKPTRNVLKSCGWQNRSQSGQSKK